MRKKPSDKTDISTSLHEMAERIKRRGLVIILSDLLDDPERIISGLKHFRYNRHEVIVFHILDPRERDFAFGGEAVFKDMETGDELSTLPYQIKKHYAQQVRSFADEIISACRQSNIDFHPIDTSTSFDKALYSFLAKRERLY